MFVLNLVTPERKMVTDTEVDEIIVPAQNGQMDVFPGHAPLMTTLGTGLLKYRIKGSAAYSSVVVSWGYCEIHPEGVIVLAEVAESLEELDRARVEEDLKRAQQALVDPLLEADQIIMTQQKMQQAQARVDALESQHRGH